MMDYPCFSGSYANDDVCFLLNPVDIDMTPVEQKERLIQSGEKHYSEMLSQEPAPTQWHLDLFARAVEQGKARLAREVSQLARGLVAHYGDQPIILTSLVRAGVPLGVMLQKTLSAMGKTSFHYGISIIRDRGIDLTALSMIEKRHGTKGIVFVDGWTGKEAITTELVASLKGRTGYPALPRLVVLADPCGCAWLSASNDDWLIPFGIMGAPVSGLISRSVWSASGLHGCMVCEHLRDYDCSQWLTDTVTEQQREQQSVSSVLCETSDQHHYALWQKSRDVITSLTERFSVDSVNRIKPGIAEATRAVLRRVPDHVLVRAMDDPDVALLVGLAKEKGLTVTEMGETLGQYRAVTIIRKVL